MKIPEGYSEKKVLKLLDKICNSLAPIYKFGIYDIEDIKQEAMIIGLTALEDYDNQAKLDAYLYTYIKDKLKNFKRQKFSRFSFNCNNCSKFNPECKSCIKRENTELSKRNLSNAIDIDSMDPTKESSIMVFDTYNEDISEVIQLINKELPIDMREDYLKIKDGSYVEKNRKLLIENTIKIILKDYL